jgi:hypothetical protein
MSDALARSLGRSVDDNILLLDEALSGGHTPGGAGLADQAKSAVGRVMVGWVGYAGASRLLKLEGVRNP